MHLLASIFLFNGYLDLDTGPWLPWPIWNKRGQYGSARHLFQATISIYSLNLAQIVNIVKGIK